MPPGLRMFGPVHIAILCTVPSLAAILAVAHRKSLPGCRVTRLALALLLLVATVSYYSYFAATGAQMFPNHVPLELCDLSLWLIIISLLTLKPAVFDVAYYWAIAGATQSLLTPNLVNPTLFLSIQFFLNHGLIVCATLYLIWSGQAKPRPGSVARSLIAANIYALIVGTFDFLFKTDYMFLRAKPPTPSLLDVFGPWPWYILVGEFVAVGLFLLLYLPFRQPASTPALSPKTLEAPSIQEHLEKQPAHKRLTS
jgi:hypothetical integral membrane protein (TIGR02206 family)